MGSIVFHMATKNDIIRQAKALVDFSKDRALDVISKAKQMGVTLSDVDAERLQSLITQEIDAAFVLAVPSMERTVELALEEAAKKASKRR